MAGPRSTNLPTAEEVRAALDYDPFTGVFRWRWRADVLPWINTRCAGKVAGSLDRRSRTNIYITIRLNGRLYLAHRLAWVWMTGEWPDGDLDHENTDGTDNRFINLRPATRTQNNGNQRLSRANTTGLKGVSPLPNGRYQAQIAYQGKNHRLGHFDSPEEAHDAYCYAAVRLFGEFARFQ